ncbi:hypothetical protein [Streptomyces abyssomicinicus]|uniref:hypothetical protein n=1 Tax=Streptomyces abyssomicinicus TaxID=574929 RepID=UPI00124F952D|nr:hypothetical protein [Streptomyces abyssomicinicus]
MTLSAGGHALATGTTPSPGVLLPCAGVAVALVAPLSARRRSVATGAGALTALQVVLHVSFALLSPSAVVHHAMTGTAHGDLSCLQPPTALLPTVPMLCGHLLAAVAMAWLLNSGEAAAERILGSYRSGAVRVIAAVLSALLSSPCLGVCGLPAPAAASHRPRRPDRAPPHGRWTLAYEVTRRGPPG